MIFQEICLDDISNPKLPSQELEQVFLDNLQAHLLSLGSERPSPFPATLGGLLEDEESRKGTAKVQDQQMRRDIAEHARDALT